MTSKSGPAEGSQETGANDDDLVANSTFNSTVKINFDGNSAAIENTVSGVTVTQSGADVVVNSSASYDHIPFVEDTIQVSNAYFNVYIISYGQ